MTADAGSFSFSGTASGINAGGFGFGFTFTPGTGSLGVGIYSNAVRFPFNGGSPGIDISGNGRGCNNECGQFQIKEFHTDGSGNVDRLWLIYTDTCECTMTAMTGEIRYHSTLAPSPGVQTFLVPSQFPTIQGAIDAAPYSGPTTILVSPGTYRETLTYGGKAITVASLAGPAKTILIPPSGQNGVNLNATETSNSIFAGFTITGVAGGAWAINCNDSAPIIIGNIITNGQNGIYCVNGSTATIASNSIVNCSGTAFYMVAGGTSPLIRNNLIEGNAAGIFSAYGASPTLINNYILSNTGDAINGFNGSPINIIQNVIAYNTGSAVSYPVPSGDRGPYIINNTVISNGYGFSIDGFDGNSLIMNNIVVGPSALNITLFNSSSTPVIWNNDIYNGGANPYSGVVSNLAGVNGNISADPLFACGISGDYRLLPTSPAINAGTNGAPGLISGDLNGNPRVIGTKIDMGAYEADPSAPASPCMYVNCPADVVVPAARGATSAVVTFPAPTGTPGATIVAVPPSGSTFPAGTNTVVCTATYGTNSVACSFSVKVLLLPSLTNALVETNVSAGRPFSLAVSPQGSGPFSYQWYFENAAIPGATANPLTVLNSQQANEGLYQVGVFNTFGGVTNVVATVRVVPTLPTILTNPVSLTVPATSTGSFGVTVIGSQPLSYQWYFASQPISGATTAQYGFSGVESSNGGNYYVMVSNGLGSVTSSVATLTVTPVAPYFILQPNGGAVSGGSNFTFTTVANGSHPINYQWQHNNTNISGAIQPTLTLTNVAFSDSGNYVLIASNLAGVVYSSNAVLTVYQVPTLMAALTNQVVDSGASVSLSAAVLGSSPLAYSWKLNGQPIAAASASTLSLNNIQPSQSGYYVITITNSFGTISSTSRVSVLGPIATITAWGDDSGGQLDVPPNLADVVAAAGGDYHTLALRHNGKLLAWGYNGSGQTNVPTNALSFVAVASGAEHSLAITQNGSLTAWGRNESGQCNVPPAASNNVLAVAAGDSHSLALSGAGLVTAWGNNSFGQLNVPQGLTGITAIAAGRQHSLALRANGTVVGWGYNSAGQASPPANLANVVAIAAGYLHSVALLSNKTVVVWGDNSFGQTNVPSGLTNVIAIAAGDFNIVALLGTGKVVSWGDDSYGQTDIPASVTNSIGIASGNYHDLALMPTAGMIIPQFSSAGLVLNWTGNATLQSAPTPTGPFTDIPANGNSFTNTSTPTQKFFRLRK